jgi:5-methyltetrahydropteroyltriglutamate--homocysteine methyltransferase
VAPRTTPPFRADHVGSLLRPPELLKARADFAAGAITLEELHAVEDTAVRDAVRMQEDVGLQSITDGEFRRGAWLADFVHQLGGVTPTRTDLSGATPEAPREPGLIELASGGTLLKVDEKLHLNETIFADDFRFLKETVSKGTPKQTIPSPSMVHYRGGRAGISESVYPDLGDFWHDLSGVYAEEIQGMWELGCTYLQLDDTSLAYVNDPKQREHVVKLGGDPLRQHHQYIAAINEAISGRPEGMSVTTHLCRGNLRSSWMAEGGYDFVAEALFNELAVDGFFLEYDDERSGGFEPLRFVPKGKIVVLGLVTTKRGALEHKDDLKRRVDEAAEFVDLDQLCLSPQCGFASVVEGNAITYDDQVAKLRLVAETAAEIWG